MQKRILIIGNNHGLPGVKVDIEKYKSFFKSSYGGLWRDNEITEKLNVSKTELLAELTRIKGTLNYLIVIFSGHGGQERETMLELNSSGECIGESELKNLAYRQLNIYDCCRSYPEIVTESLKAQLRTNLFSAVDTRQKFEERIMAADHQQVSLYACSIGEYANDTNEGGAYSKNLISVARNIDEEFMLVGTGHMKASLETTKEFPKQHPDSIIPRLMSSKQLIFAIKP
jgi:hypothetical protein